jgi:glucosamine-6-phosphate deaminase
MVISVSKTPGLLGIQAAKLASRKLNDSIIANGNARLVLATGSSQFETLESLLKQDISWEKIEIFHLDEYIGLPLGHKASFRKYLYDRFISHIKCKRFYSIDTEEDIPILIERLSAEITKAEVDVGMIGIGENGHIAFNDPPADFDTNEPYIVVRLDERCRQQQVGEDWFSRLAEVPEKAVSMSVKQILKCKTIISAVPHKVKSEAVRKTLTTKPSNLVPATILKQHPDFNLFLDYNSASEVFNL